MTLEGQTKAAEQKFTLQNRQYGLRMLKSKLQPPEIKLAHHTVHLPKQQYQFNGNPFTRKYLENETNKMTTNILPQMNISRNHPKALRHAPKDRGGLALPHLYVCQGTTMIRQALRHIRLHNTLGKYLLIHLKWTQLQTGLQTGILSDTSTNIDYVNPNWWTKLREFLQYIQGNIQLEQTYTTPPLQENDYAVMEEIWKHKTWTRRELKQINACRMYLQITYISELTTNKKD